MCQQVTIRLVFKIKINYYFSCFIWHSDIDLNTVQYCYKKQHTKWCKVLNQIWKNTIFKTRVIQNEEETEFLLHMENACFHSKADWKQTWKEVDASWEITCCKAFLRHGESPPIAQSQGRWVRHHREEEAKENQNWYDCRRQGKGEMRQHLSLPRIT